MWIEQKLNMTKKKKEEIQELNKQTKTSLVNVVFIPLLINLSVLFVMFHAYTKLLSKEDKKLSAQLKKILKDGKDWKVMVIVGKDPNAFCMVRPYVFISTGLMKMLTQDEVMAVLLHEAGHITNKDIWTDIIAKNSLLSILLGVAGTMLGPMGMGVLLLIYFYGGDSFINVIFARIIGRFKENRADSFAVKHGYGDAMASALSKLDKFIKKMLAKEECNKMCQIGRKINDAIDEHPPFKERIERVLKAKETYNQTKNKSFVGTQQYFMKAFRVKKPV